MVVQELKKAYLIVLSAPSGQEKPRCVSDYLKTLPQFGFLFPQPLALREGVRDMEKTISFFLESTLRSKFSGINLRSGLKYTGTITAHPE